MHFADIIQGRFQISNDASVVVDLDARAQTFETDLTAALYAQRVYDVTCSSTIDAPKHAATANRFTRALDAATRRMLDEGILVAEEECD
jgi:5-deoxy-D-glucuronate isomerase